MAVDRLRALEMANEVRSRRARLYESARRGQSDLRAVILRPEPWIERAPVERVLRAVPGVGRARAAEILRRTKVSPTRALGELTERQRRQIVEVLR